VLETSTRAQNLSQSKPQNFYSVTLALSGLVSECGRGQSSGGEDFVIFGQGHMMVKRKDNKLTSLSIVLDVYHKY
jgi:hypothetical protein